MILLEHVGYYSLIDPTKNKLVNLKKKQSLNLSQIFYKPCNVKTLPSLGQGSSTPLICQCYYEQNRESFCLFAV